MNSNINYNERVTSLKELQLEDIDVKEQVMAKIYNLSNQKISKKQNKVFIFRSLPVWTTILLTLFLVTGVTVSAAVLIPWNWNGIQLSVDDTKVKSLSPVSEISTKERILQWLTDNPLIWKKVPLAEAEKTLPYIPLRPNKEYTKMKRTETFAILNQAVNYHVKSVNELWIGGVYDIYEKEQQNILVRQNLDGEMSKSLSDPDLKLSLTYVGSWEKIDSSEQMVMMYKSGDKENDLVVSFKSEDNKVISLELTGTKGVTKQELLDLAKTYTE